MNLLRFVKPVKDLVVPDETRPRRLRAGLCSGLTMELNPSHDLWVQLGLYEREVRDHVRRAVRPGDTCYDVGAGFGYYTLAMARLADPGTVVALEPDAARREQLARNVSYNELGGTKVDVRGELVGERTSDDMVSIDALVFDEKLLPPDVIKMDIEGGEGAALRGAARTLAQHHPRLIVETHSHALQEECFAMLTEHGYDIATVRPDTRWLRDRPRIHRRWLAAHPPDHG